MSGPSASTERCISAIVPVYNREALLPACLDSLLAQTHPHVEIVVVDDGSTDGTPGVLERYGDRIRILRQPNAGPYVARNRGVAQASGAWLTFVDSDDRLHPEKFARQLALLERHPEAVLVYTHIAYRDPSGRRWIPRNQSMIRGDLSREMVRTFGGSIPWPTALVRRGALDELGGFDTAHRVAMDRELGIRLAQVGKFELIPEPLYEYTLHGDHISQDLDRREPAALHILGKLKRLEPHCHDTRLMDAAAGQMHLQLARLAYMQHESARARAHLARAVAADRRLARERAVHLLRLKIRLGRRRVQWIGRLLGRRRSGWA